VRERSGIDNHSLTGIDRPMDQANHLGFIIRLLTAQFDFAALNTQALFDVR
jgi:hypothetical protein